MVFLLITGRVFPVFWGGDEMLCHWPIMVDFSRTLPWVNLNYELSATTPLLHLFGAVFIRLFGPHLQVQRTLNALVSIGGVLAWYGMLRRTRRHAPASAALLCATVAGSAYFFGYSFRLMTDNLALVCCILAIAQLGRFAESGGTDALPNYLWGCLWCSLSMLTRQSFAFLCFPFAIAFLASSLPLRGKLVAAIGLGLAILPVAAIFVHWGGVVPPVLQVRHARGLVHPYALCLALMVVGVYAGFFVGPGLARRFANGTMNWRRWPVPCLAAAAGLVAVARIPLKTLPPLRPGGGWIYTIAGRLPELGGNSVLFWVLLPCGCAAAAYYARNLLPGLAAETEREDGVPGFAVPMRCLAAWCLLGVVLGSATNVVAAQKYEDGAVLLFFTWCEGPNPAGDPWRRAGLLALLSLFLLYYVSAPVLSPGM